jgi:hypothetical protein
MMKYVVALFLIASLAGCAYWPRAGINGVFYANTTSPVTVSAPEEPTKKGRACSSGVLGLYGSGDSTIDTAKKMGGITKIAYVEEEFHHVFLGFYSRYCVIVSGW